MLADVHVSLTGSASAGLGILSAWHAKNTHATDDLVLNIRNGGAGGMVVIPIILVAKGIAGEEYANPLHSTNGHWYVEFVSGTGVIGLSGRS